MGLNANQNMAVLNALVDCPELLDALLVPSDEFALALAAAPTNVNDAWLALEEAISNE